MGIGIYRTAVIKRMQGRLLAARAAESFVFALGFGEIATLYRRAADRRPYKIIGRLYDKLKFELQRHRIGQKCRMGYAV